MTKSPRCPGRISIVVLVAVTFATSTVLIPQLLAVTGFPACTHLKVARGGMSDCGDDRGCDPRLGIDMFGNAICSGTAIDITNVRLSVCTKSGAVKGDNCISTNSYTPCGKKWECDAGNAMEGFDPQQCFPGPEIAGPVAPMGGEGNFQCDATKK